MRKLIKINSFAIEYQAEIAKHSENNHPNYESSDFRSSYYYDVYYSLLIAQNGLCAYSESLIIDDILQSDLKANFINGKYNDKDIGKADGDIDKENPLYVTTKSNCPAVLVELFFMTNRKECKEILMTEEGQNRMAKCIVNAIKAIEKTTKSSQE